MPREVPNILERIRSEVPAGTVIPKPQARADFVVKGWGTRRGEKALVYLIPNHRSPRHPYQKGITESEWLAAFEQLTRAGELTRSWFDAHLRGCSREGGCNFTTIGGVLELLGLTRYLQGRYVATRRAAPA